MPRPDRLFRMVNEIVFVLLGGFLMLFALTGRYLFFALSLTGPRRTLWLALSVVVIFWGVRAWRLARRIAAPSDRLVTNIAAASLALTGLIMLSLVWAPFSLLGWLLIAAGAIFVLRGLVSAVLMARA